MDPFQYWPKKHIFQTKLWDFYLAGWSFSRNLVDPSSDRLQCRYCPLSLNDWRIGNNPFIQHALYNPYCINLQAVKGMEWIRKHARVRPTHTLPNLQWIVQQIETYPVCYQHCPSHPKIRNNGDDAISLQPILLDDDTHFLSQTLYISQRVGVAYVTPKGLPFVPPDNNTFVPYRARLESLRRFGRLTSVFSLNKFAGAGFYWPGAGSSLKCYYCSIVVDQFAVNDDPYEIHAAMNEKCFHLILEKGEAYIDHVNSPRMDRMAIQEEDISDATGDDTLRYCSNCNQVRNERAFMCCLACRRHVCYTEECLVPKCCP